MRLASTFVVFALLAPLYAMASALTHNCVHDQLEDRLGPDVIAAQSYEHVSRDGCVVPMDKI